MVTITVYMGSRSQHEIDTSEIGNFDEMYLENHGRALPDRAEVFYIPRANGFLYNGFRLTDKEAEKLIEAVEMDMARQQGAVMHGAGVREGGENRREAAAAPRGRDGGRGRG